MHCERLHSRKRAFVYLGLALCLPGLQSNAQSPDPPANVSEQYLKTAADAERSALGLPPLRVDAALTMAARQHALRMADCRCISHQLQGEADLATRAGDAGAKFTRVTENVAQAPGAIRIHQAWMRSEGHRHNLLDREVDSVGIAVVERNGQMFAAEDFMRMTASISLSQQEKRVSVALRSLGIATGTPDRDARRVCEGTTPSNAKAEPDFVVRYTTADLDTLPEDLTSQLRNGTFTNAVVAACAMSSDRGFSMYRLGVTLYRDRPGR